MTTRPSAPFNIKASDGKVGRTQAMPDERVLVAFEDGRSVVVDADRLKPREDRTYRLELAATDKLTDAPIVTLPVAES